jgi:uncharacterized membrane protein YphA (DoxX/SURF4 family)
VRDNAANLEVLGRGYAALRVLLGLVFLLNGLSKLVPGWAQTLLGYLIDSNLALAVLRNAVESHPVGAYADLMQSIVLANWGVFAVALGVFEVGVGALLIVGLWTRWAAIAGALFAMHLQFMAVGAGHWLFQHALVWGPLLVLAWVGAGRFAGLDGRRVRSLPDDAS